MKMEGLKTAWHKSGSWISRHSGKSTHESDDRMAVADSILSELDFHIKELNKVFKVYVYWILFFLFISVLCILVFYVGI